MPRSVLFVVSRFHTALAGAVRALDGIGDRVSIFAVETRAGEDHSLIVPWEFGPDPAPADVARALDRVAPDMIVLGDAGPLSDQVAKHATTRKIAMVAYDATPLDRRWSLVRRARHLLKERPLDRITPVPGAGGTPDPRARLVPWPVFGDPDPKARPLGGTDVSILSVGHLLDPAQGQDRLIAALDDLPDDLRWSLTLAGSDARDGSVSDRHLSGLRSRAEDPTAMRAVRIRSNIPFREMPDLYRAHDICILTTEQPLGMAALEGMAFGCVPVVASGTGAAGYIEHGRTGIVMNTKDAGALRDALAEVIVDPGRLRTMSAAAHAAAAERFGMRAFLDAFDGLFDPWKVDF